MMTGGLSDTKDATPEIQHIVNQVKPQFESKENRNCAMFAAIVYKTQVVAGINYFIKPQCAKKMYAGILVTETGHKQNLYPVAPSDASTPKQFRSLSLHLNLKVQVSDTEYVHLKVFQSLPHENQGPSLVSFQTGKTRDDPLTYF